MSTSASADISAVVSARVAMASTSRSMMRTYSRRLKRASSAAVSVSNERDRMRAKSFLKFFAGVRAIQTLLACEAMEEIGIVDQGFAQPGTMAKHHHRVMHEREMLFQQLEQLSRGALCQPFELIDRGIGIGRGWQQCRERLVDFAPRQLADVRENPGSRLGVAKLEVRRTSSRALFQFRHHFGFYNPRTDSAVKEFQVANMWLARTPCHCFRTRTGLLSACLLSFTVLFRTSSIARSVP